MLIFLEILSLSLIVFGAIFSLIFIICAIRSLSTNSNLEFFPSCVCLVICLVIALVGFIFEPRDSGEVIRSEEKRISYTSLTEMSKDSGLRYVFDIVDDDLSAKNYNKHKSLITVSYTANSKKDETAVVVTHIYKVLGKFQVGTKDYYELNLYLEK